MLESWKWRAAAFNGKMQTRPIYELDFLIMPLWRYQGTQDSALQRQVL